MRARALGYGLVLLLVIASIALQMTTSGSTATRFMTVTLQAGTVVAAVRISAIRHGLRLAALAAVTAVAVSIFIWALHGNFPVAAAGIVNGLLVAVAPVAIAGGLLRDIRQVRRVTVATLAGVLSIYLLAGMFFSFLYGVIGAIDADALFTEVTNSSGSEQLYFSFVTMCTVGYGDLTPASDLSRMLAVSEMLLGQIYLVTVVALIVSNLGRIRD